MKKIIILTLMLLFAIANVDATDINEIALQDNDYGETIQADIQNNYLINNTRQLESTFNIKVKENHTLHSYIDYRNIETEASSGGYIDNGKYILPHDLGLGQHNICFILEDQYGNVIGKTSYKFNILKNINDNPSLYEGYTPYYYENIDNDMIEEDYATFNALYNNIYEDNDIAYEIVDDNILIKKIIIPAGLTKVNVKLGIINDIDNSLTSAKI